MSSPAENAANPEGRVVAFSAQTGQEIVQAAGKCALQAHLARCGFTEALEAALLLRPRAHDIEASLAKALNEAEEKAWDSLARYKFQMFGYWAAIWVHLNHISGERRPSPFASAVRLARERRP